MAFLGFYLLKSLLKTHENLVIFLFEHFLIHELQYGKQGSYRKLQPFFKDFSRTFQGPNLFFKDPPINVNSVMLQVK